jgi:hypothetical protein
MPPPPAARRTVRAKAGAAEARPSSPPDAVTYSASISTDTPLHEPPGVSHLPTYDILCECGHG